jgi:hypothetical protein
MKKILLSLAAIFIASQLFSQDAEKITITYNYGDMFNEYGHVHALSMLDKQPFAINVGPEKSTRIIDIKNMQVTFYSDAVDTVVLDIVKYEKLNNGIIHIVSDERNTLFSEEDNVRIFTHTYVDVKNNLSVYSWTWGEDDFAQTFASKAVNPKIIIQ